MRTTLTLDLDVSVRSREAAARAGLSLKQVINTALRIGLDEMLKREVSKRYRTEPRAMGLRGGLSYDNVAELLAIGQQ
jgi:hypothetical protein